MKIVTAKQMRTIDERAQSEFGVPENNLMEEAGRAVTRRVIQYLHDTAGNRVCIVCGKGNNAGDGFVVARLLQDSQAAVVEVVCLTEPANLRGAAAWAYREMTVSGLVPQDAEQLTRCLEQCDLVVDAILGTGVRGPVSETLGDAINAINASGRNVVAVDVPSGLRQLNPEETPGPIIQADMTVTIGLPKNFMLDPFGARLCGTVHVEPINFPPELLNDNTVTQNWASRKDLRSWLPRRETGSNKGTFGWVGIVGGSAQYAGAAILCARAALRAGCGLVTIFTTSELNMVYKVALPEAITSIVPGSNQGALDASSAEAILEAASRMSVLAIGPGLTSGESQVELVGQILRAWDRPLVVDADGLNCVAKMLDGRSDDAVPLLAPGLAILTPHPGEMARLVKQSVADIQTNRQQFASDFAAQHGVNLLLKGEDTLVATSDGQTWLNRGGTSALAKGGTGDVLTGVIAGLIAQGMQPAQAAVLGARVHLDAGIACARRTGLHGVLASEVCDQVSRELSKLEQGDEDR